VGGVTVFPAYLVARITVINGSANMNGLPTAALTCWCAHGRSEIVFFDSYGLSNASYCWADEKARLGLGIL
jgi:hypothetical protein